MALLEADGNAYAQLTRESFKDDGELVSKEDELSIVVGSLEEGEAWIANNQHTILWPDADIFYQAPRPLTLVNGTYVLEPNVRRFVVLTACNSVVPQLMKGLFYENPPFVMRPRPGTAKEITDAKKAVAAALLDKMEFQRNIERFLEQFVLYGTGIVKWGVRYEEELIETRIDDDVQVPGAAGQSTAISVDAEPNIKEETRTVCVPFFEFRDIRDVIVDPHNESPDIRDGGWLVDKRYMDFYELSDLRQKEGVEYDDEGYDIPDDLIDYFFDTAESNQTPGETSAANMSSLNGIVHHAEKGNVKASPDPLRKKLEVAEYQDRERIIVVLNRKKVIRSCKNKFNCITYFSANYVNRPKAFWGIGVGVLMGQDQLLQQGSINSALKILAYGVNPIYLRSRDSNAPTQMIKSELGRIHTVDGKVDEAFRLMETPKVPSELLTFVSESRGSAESASGADSMLMGGSSSSGGRVSTKSPGSMGMLQNASATRLENPLNHFLNQVYVPWLYTLDRLIKLHVGTQQIKDIIGEQLGDKLVLDMKQYHNSKYQFEELVGTRMSVKRNIAQSLTMLTQMFQNGQLVAEMAKQGKNVNIRPIIRLWLESSEVGSGIENDIITDMSPEEKQQYQQSQAGNNDMAKKQQLISMQTAAKSQLNDEETNNRIKRDLVKHAAETSAMSEVVEGQPGGGGFGDAV